MSCCISCCGGSGGGELSSASLIASADNAAACGSVCLQHSTSWLKRLHGVCLDMMHSWVCACMHEYIQLQQPNTHSKRLKFAVIFIRHERSWWHGQCVWDKVRTFPVFQRRKSPFSA